jgi:hypothetical protein
MSTAFLDAQKACRELGSTAGKTDGGRRERQVCHFGVIANKRTRAGAGGRRDRHGGRMTGRTKGLGACIDSK